ncbi:hypothetical protein ACFLQM_01345 [Acidobacteriota bacterium]
MAVTTMVLMAALSGSVLSPGAVTDFPGGYFDTRVRESFQRHVMASWPGPTELMRLWRDGDLSQEQRVALLLGGAVYHDPLMLSAYREALESDSLRVRQAAIYGYRDLIGDRLPNVDVTIDEKALTKLAGEMRWVQRTLSRQPLLAMWLQSALANEGTSLPGYIGVNLMRSTNDCFGAAERLVDIGDLDLLVTAYEQSQDMGSRIALLKLIESVSVSRFLMIPRGPKTGWGKEVFESAQRNLDIRVGRWRSNRCQLDGEEILLQNLRSIGAKNNDPLGPSAVRLWLAVLESENSRWWALAARRLYACGGPWMEFSVLYPDSERNRERRDQLVEWYEPLLAPNRGQGHSRTGR